MSDSILLKPFYVVVAIIFGVMFVAMLNPDSFTDKEHAGKVLSAHGYTNITYTGYSHFSCADDDWYATGFKALTPQGYPVEGTVCSDFFKDSTIRFK